MHLTNAHKYMLSEYIHYDILNSDPLFRARPMFGGYGLYYDGVFFGIIADEVIYLYTTHISSSDNVFTYTKHGRVIPLRHYHQIPDDILDDMEEFSVYIDTAIAQAREK